MSDSIAATGTCLCGLVKISVKNLTPNVAACHCSICRHWGGGPYMSVDCGSEVSVDGEEYVSVYHSSDWAERGFCNQCGGHLYYRLKESNQYFMPAGLFDSEVPLVFDHQVFIDDKPTYYTFKNETKDMTGAEIFAQFAPPAD